uniref:RIKEN cDNA 4933402N03 gene n=1 Tax=Nannospalax galili TaxID=1026970 RepID=A0A8C6R1A6_NANGA
MIREWENCYQRMRTQKPGHPRAQEGTAAKGELNSRISPRILSASHPWIAQNFPRCKEDLCPATPLGVWTTFYKSDPRIALGKYSPMEKEILRLGGIHTIATRRFLAVKHDKEGKMLRELRSRSPDYEKATKYKRGPFFPCAAYQPPEKMWTAKVVVPAEEFKVPQREMIDISKHVQRMRLARALRNKQCFPCTQRLSLETDKTSEEQDKGDSDNFDQASQEEEQEAEHKTTKAREIIMNVVFKSEELKPCVVCHRNDRKTFLPVKRERCITGLTNRNLFSIADFPGDLMLMQQDFKSRGIHPNDAIQTYWAQEEDACREQPHRASRCLY